MLWELAAVVWGTAVVGLGAAVIVATLVFVIVAVVQESRLDALRNRSADGAAMTAGRPLPLDVARVLAIASIALGSLGLSALPIATVSPIPHILSAIGVVFGVASFRRYALRRPLPYLGAGISVAALGWSLILSGMAATCTGPGCGIN
ncbi:hypothetical protein GCM10028798_34120 [Humibacter antri]